MKLKLQTSQEGRTRSMVSLQEQLLQEAFQKKTIITLILLNGFHT